MQEDRTGQAGNQTETDAISWEEQKKKKKSCKMLTYKQRGKTAIK